MRVSYTGISPTSTPTQYGTWELVSRRDLLGLINVALTDTVDILYLSGNPRQYPYYYSKSGGGNGTTEFILNLGRNGGNKLAWLTPATGNGFINHGAFVELWRLGNLHLQSTDTESPPDDTESDD